MRLGRWLLPLAFVLGLAGSADAAPTGKERADAAVLTNKARAAAKAKRHDEAADLLRQADQLDPTPQRKLDLAKSLGELGKLVEASSLLNGVANDTVGPGAARFKDTAKKQLAQIETRIPWLSVKVIGPTSGVHVEVDGKEVQPDMESPVDPGAHSVGVDAAGFESGDQRVTVKEGEHKQVTITLEPTAKAAPKPKESSGTKVPAIAAFGVGAVGLGVGAVFGILAFDETGKAKQFCDGNKCPARPEVVSARNTAIANGNVSTVGFVVGGVGIAAGIVLLLTVGSSSSKPSDEKADEKTDTVSWTPYFGASQTAGEAGVIGRF
jgi:hypothetical protein